MTTYSDENYDPGFLNSPGKGQSVTNPLAPAFFQSLGVVSDVSVYGSIFAGQTVNSEVGYTLGTDNFFGKDGFSVSAPGVFRKDCSFQEDVNISMNLTVGGVIIMGGQRFKPTVINTISGPHLVLAAY